MIYVISFLIGIGLTMLGIWGGMELAFWWVFKK